MKGIRLLIAAAVLGVVIVTVAVVRTGRPPAVDTAPPTTPTPTAPYRSFVAGSGITETGRGNVSVGTSIAGVVRDVRVRVGDSVDAGQVLFVIDDREARARLGSARASVDEAQAALAKPAHRLQYLSHLDAIEKGLVSRDMVTAAQDDVAAARSSVQAARAAAMQASTELERLVVRAPIAAKVLQVNVRVGQYADNAAGVPLILLGNDERMYLRVNIDESDAWRVRPGAAAVAVLRGGSSLRIPLHFEYVEPYITPKPSLTGQVTERPDLRVLQIVYSFDRGQLPVYLGQQMDAYIQADATAAGRR